VSRSAATLVAVAAPPQPSRRELRERVRAGAENRPGIYRIFGPAGELLYVGKSVRGRSRLLSYFRARRAEKAHEIIGHAHHIDWEYVPSEFAALLLELRTIRRWRPRFNVEHKHDRAYCFIKVTREPAPRLLVVDRLVADRSHYFGPFRGRRRLREALRELGDLLELRDCAAATPMRFADQGDLFGTPEATPRCLRADLGRCLAPCAARCTRTAYLARVAVARRFLEGDADRPLALLRERMDAAAARLHFEYAAELRDRATRLEGVRDELTAMRGTLASLAFVYHVPGHNGDDRAYLVRGGTVRAELPAPGDAAGMAALRARVAQVLGEAEVPGEGLPADQIAEALLLAKWFRLRPAERARTTPMASPAHDARQQPRRRHQEAQHHAH
jgi:excinuclease ABC subunit C